MKKNIRRKIFYKKFLRLNINPLTNNKFLKFKVFYDYKKNSIRGPKAKKEFFQIDKFKKKKWVKFLDFLKKTNKPYRKFKPYKIYSYEISKFASQGNSFKKKFKNDLIAKQIFCYMRGGVAEKYLKNKIAKIYSFDNYKSLVKITIEFFESRLDSVLYRSKFSYSIKNAQQLIAHKHIKVNNKIEKNKSYILKQGDFIQISLIKSIEIVKMNLSWQLKERPDCILRPIIPNYLTVNFRTLEIIFCDIKNFNFSTVFTFRFNSFFTKYY